jgi:acetyl esterase/lipase
MSVRALFGSLLVAMTVASTHVSAGEFIQIESGTNADPVRVVGYMSQPPGAGPFPAVVLLHGCGGFHSSMISWADRLSRFGYAALAIESFGPRGFDERCVGFFLEQVADGHAALRYLTTRPFVRASHVAVMGFSQGGGSVLAAMEKGPRGTALPIEIPRRHRLLSGMSVRLEDHDRPGTCTRRWRRYLDAAFVL